MISDTSSYYGRKEPRKTFQLQLCLWFLELYSVRVFSWWLSSEHIEHAHDLRSGYRPHFLGK